MAMGVLSSRARQKTAQNALSSKPLVHFQAGVNLCQRSLCTSEMSPPAGLPSKSPRFMFLSVFVSLSPSLCPVSLDPGLRMVP